ncbi:hypothetical protein [Komagataeibacter sp. FNDCR2]|nr:hypothetical protein [Komagataeibacter sp. FNDCR2]MCE2575257.1 hypothetical protein [Komagataeibacter sp. FNDCR2]
MHDLRALHRGQQPGIAFGHSVGNAPEILPVSRAEYGAATDRPARR